MPRRRNITPEGSVSSAIKDYLAAMRIWFERMNTGKIRMEYTNRLGETKRRMVQFGTPGRADILCTPMVWIDHPKDPDLHVKIAVVFWIETKATTEQSGDQKEFEKTVAEAGHYYLVARSVEDVKKAFAAIGVADVLQ